MQDQEIDYLLLFKLCFLQRLVLNPKSFQFHWFFNYQCLKKKITSETEKYPDQSAVIIILSKSFNIVQRIPYVHSPSTCNFCCSDSRCLATDFRRLRVPIALIFSFSTSLANESTIKIKPSAIFWNSVISTIKHINIYNETMRKSPMGWRNDSNTHYCLAIWSLPTTLC